MSKLQKRSLLLVFVLIMALSVGCSNVNQESSGNKGIKNQDSVKQGEAEKKDEPKTEEPKEPVTLKYSSWMSKGEDKPLLQEFMKKYPHITVEDEVFDGAKYNEMMKTRILSDAAQDVFLFQWIQYPQFVKEGWLLDVTNELGTEHLKKSEMLTSAYTVGGKLYGSHINGGVNVWPIYYNKSYFTKLGITPPKSIEEFYAISEKISADGVEPLVFGGKDKWPVANFFNQFRFTDTNGQYPKQNELLHKGEVKPSQLYKSTLELMKNIVDNGYIGKSSLTLTYDQSVQYFVDGKAAMIPQGTWVPGLEAIKNAKDLDLGVFLFPYKKDNGKVHALAGIDRSIGIYSGTKHPEEAKLLYNFFLEKANLENYLSTQSLTTLLPGIQPETSPVLTEYLNALNDPNQYQLSANEGNVTYPGFAPIFRDAYLNILAGSTVVDELKKADEQFEKIKGGAVVSE